MATQSLYVTTGTTMWRPCFMSNRPISITFPIHVYGLVGNTWFKPVVTCLRVRRSNTAPALFAFKFTDACLCSKSSVGVVHLVMVDHDLTDAERTTLALTLTSALAANSNKLQLGHDDVNVSKKPEMFVAGKKGTHSQL